MTLSRETQRALKAMRNVKGWARADLDAAIEHFAATATRDEWTEVLAPFDPDVEYTFRTDDPADAGPDPVFSTNAQRLRYRLPRLLSVAPDDHAEADRLRAATHHLTMYRDSDLSWLRGLDALTSVSVPGHNTNDGQKQRAIGFEALGELPELRRLHVALTDLRELAPPGLPHTLDTLRVRNCFFDGSTFAGLPARDVKVWDFHDSDRFDGALHPETRSLLVSNGKELAELDVASSHLRDLRVMTSPCLERLALPSCLEALYVRECGVSTVSLPEPLRTLELFDLDSLEALEGAHLDALERVVIRRCPFLEDVSPLASATALRHVEIRDTGVSDVSWLRALPNVATVDLRGCEAIASFPELANVDGLRLAALGGTGIRPDDLPSGVRATWAPHPEHALMTKATASTRS